jgi:predicted ATPase
MTPPFLQRLFLQDGVDLPRDAFPGNLPFIRSLELRFTNAVTFFVGENGSGKSTVMEAIAAACGLPPAGRWSERTRRS